MAACGMPSMQGALTPQERVTKEWDQMAGEWDDLASGYAAGFAQRLWGHTLPSFLLKSPPTNNHNHNHHINTTNTDEQVKILEAIQSSWNVLDFGCGTGLLTDHLRHKVQHVVAMDVSSKMIQVLEEKILCQEWTNTQALHCVLADLDKDDDNNNSMRETIEDMYGTMDLIVASSVLTFIPENDVEPTLQVLGKLLKPGTGWLVHSDWPRSEAKHPDAMDNDKATMMYAAAGLKAVSMDIVKIHTGVGETMDVFWGVAQKE